MAANNKVDKELVKVLLTVVMAVSFCVFIWIFLNDQAARLGKGYMDGVTKDNEYIVEAVSSYISSSATDQTQAVDLLASAPSTGTRYWFMLSSEALIFEKNADITADLAGMTYRELSDAYIRNGGSGGSEFYAMIEKGQEFTAVVTKDRKDGRELISVTFIEVSGQKYCIGTSILQNYMYSTGKIGERIFMLRVMTLVMCCILVALASYYSYANRKKAIQIRVLKHDLTEKNMLVQEQGERMFETDADVTDQSADQLTGLYNRKFFDAVIAKMTTRNVENVGFIFIRIDNLHTLHYENGFASTNRLLVDTAKHIGSSTTDKDICARVSKNEFAILAFDTSYKMISHSASKLLGELKELYPSAEFSEGYSFAWKDTDIASAVEAARAALSKKNERTSQ
jgi:diguanylate cyclase (GGDEF)-like protein